MDGVSTLSDKPPLSVAAANDGQFLYLAIRTSDPGTRRMIERQGLVVWIDAKGKKDRSSVCTTRKRPRCRRPATDSSDGRAARAAAGTAGAAAARRPAAQEGQAQPRGPPPIRSPTGRWQHMEIVGPGKNDKRDLMLDHVPGIQVKVGDQEGVLTYELRVPLQATSDAPYAIGVKPGAVIGLGLETPKIERPRRPGGFGGGFSGRGGGEPAAGWGRAAAGAAGSEGKEAAARAASPAAGCAWSRSSSGPR